MRGRVAAWVLCLVALVCGLGGLSFAEEVVSSYRVDPDSLGPVIADAMFATALLVLAGCAVIGLVVLRGVAEMLNQALQSADRVEPPAGTDGPVEAPVHERPADQSRTTT